MKAGTIVGIGVGSAIFLVVVAVLVVVLMKRHKDKHKRDKAEGRTGEDLNPVYGLYECDPQVTCQQMIILIPNVFTKKSCCSFGFRPNEGGRAFFCHLFISAFLVNKMSLFLSCKCY